MILEGKELPTVDRFSYLGSCVTKNGSRVLAMSKGVSNARAAYAERKRSWHRPDISHKLNDYVRCTVVRSILLYGIGMWILCAEYFSCLDVFNHRLSCSVARIGRSYRVTISLGTSRVRYFGHVPFMENIHALPRASFFVHPRKWKNLCEGQ